MALRSDACAVERRVGCGDIDIATAIRVITYYRTVLLVGMQTVSRVLERGSKAATQASASMARTARGGPLSDV